MKGECDMIDTEIEKIMIPLDVRLNILDILHKAIEQNLEVNELVKNILDVVGGKRNEQDNRLSKGSL
jgi:hypothetical protein